MNLPRTCGRTSAGTQVDVLARNMSGVIARAIGASVAGKLAGGAIATIPPTPRPGSFARASRSRNIGRAGSYAHPFRLRAEGRLPAAEAVVLEPGRLHLGRLEEISPVNDDRGSHERTDPAEVQRPELLPVGEDDQRVGVPDCLKGRFHVGEAVTGRIQRFELPGGGKGVDAQAGPCAVQTGGATPAGAPPTATRVRCDAPTGVWSGAL